jgi:adenylylsulfate kinase
MEVALSTPFVLWLTGLPKSGKTEIAELLLTHITPRLPAELIDSSKIRKTPIGETLGFSRDDRENNIRRHALAAKLLNQNGVIAVVSAVSPYKDIRTAIRNEFELFAEIYVQTPVADCIKRDHSGTYQRAISGEIPNYTGISAPYEPPTSAEVCVDASTQSIEDCVNSILSYLQASNWLNTKSQLKTETDAIANSLKLLGYSDD